MPADLFREWLVVRLAGLHDFSLARGLCFDAGDGVRRWLYATTQREQEDQPDNAHNEHAEHEDQTATADTDTRPGPSPEPIGCTHDWS